jgi:hypothetical protein
MFRIRCRRMVHLFYFPCRGTNKHGP